MTKLVKQLDELKNREIDELKAKLEAAEKERDEAKACCAEMRGALKYWQTEYPKELDLAERRIASCKADGDGYGVNFHQGLKSGLIWNDILLNRLKDAAKASDCGKDFVRKSEVAPLVETLRFYDDAASWHKCLAGSDIGNEIRDGDPFMAFDKGEDQPWKPANEALALARKLGIQ